MTLDWLRQDKDTIAAIATAQGEGGVGILRMSGPESRAILDQFFRPHHSISTWRSHRLHFGVCLDEEGEMLDEVLAVWMAHGKSYTGEDVVEIHAHGGRLNLLQLLRRVFALGARPAAAGEFTRRAFLHGRIDLTRAEAIADLIAAKNEQALRIARNHLQGRLQGHLDVLAERSMMLAAQVESWIDFPEEFDPTMDQAVAKIFEDMDAFQAQLETLASSYSTGRQLQEGWKLTLLGRPNAGKSSLFNRLAGEERAIVTAVPGTTRDLLETQLALGGIQLSLTDTAGLRRRSTPFEGAEDEVSSALHLHESIEQIGVSRALEAAQHSHLVLVVFDRSRPWSEEDAQVVAACEGKSLVFLLNKSDLEPQLEFPADVLATLKIHATLELSCTTGEGLEEFCQWLERYLEEQTPAQDLVITNERQRDALLSAHAFVCKALEEGFPLGPEFMAEDLRAARNALAQITGQVSSEDILTSIFSRFCIGK